MIRLNLGCGNPNDRSWHPIEGWTNRDPALDGWRFEDGLGDYANGSVEAITVSHALMYLADDAWPAFIAECARVLCDEGVLRITEDHCTDTRSRTYPKGWQGSQKAVCLTSPEMVKTFLCGAGLRAVDCDPDQTNFVDRSIIQQQHGEPPDVFFVEGIRMTRVLFEPHADDGALFAAFTILKYRPHVVTCFGSSGDYGPTKLRAKETADAMPILGAPSWEQWDGDVIEQMHALDARLKPSLVFAPNMQASHPDHVVVAHAAAAVFGDRLRTYHTYDAGGKVRAGRAVEFEPIWIQHKLRALARYPSQLAHPRACKFFLDGLDEWAGE